MRDKLDIDLVERTCASGEMIPGVNPFSYFINCLADILAQISILILFLCFSSLYTPIVYCFRAIITSMPFDGTNFDFR